LVQPIREALNAKFEPLHKALDQFIVPVSQKAQDLIRAIHELEPEMAKEVGGLIRETGQATRKAVTKSVEDIAKKRTGKGMMNIRKAGESVARTAKDVTYSVRSTLNYREADKLVSRLSQFAHSSPRLAELAGEVEREIDAVAHAQGLGKERTELKALWGEMQAVKNAAVASVKDKSAIRQVVKAVSSKAGAILADGEKVVGGPELQAAEELLRKIQGSKAASSVRRGIGKAGQAAAGAWKAIPPAWRAAVSAMQNNADDTI
jgi:hypothetical protein